MVLADFGADVVKVEPPGGDRFRAAGRGAAVAARQAQRHRRPGDGRRARRPARAGADGRRASSSPARRRGPRRWGIDADAATALRPDLVHCSITGWGPRGPLAEVPGWDAAVAARSGRMMAFERQLRRGGPVFAAVPVASHVAAHGAVQGIVAGAVRPGPRRRRRSASRRACCRACCRSTSSSCCSSRWPSAAASRRRTSRPSAATCRRSTTTRCAPADGRWIQCGNLLEHLLLAFLDATDLLGELLVDERFVGAAGAWDEATIDVARDRILVRMQERTAAEWMDDLPGQRQRRRRGVPDDRPRRSTTPTSSATATSSRSTTRCTGPCARSARSPS